MNWPLTIFIISSVLLAIILVGRFVEMKTGKYMLPFSFRHCGDNLIRKILLAVFKNVVKIKKLVRREMYLLPRRFFRLTHKIWSKTKEKIDQFYDKVHR